MVNPITAGFNSNAVDSSIMHSTPSAGTHAIRVQLCYALGQQVYLLNMLQKNTDTIAQALSQFQEKHPEVNFQHCKFGVFGKIKPPDTVLKDGDRIEIYQALLANPMDARRRRAKAGKINVKSM